MLLFNLGSETWGSYKDLEIMMRKENLIEVEILETTYCFQKVEGYRLLKYHEILKLSINEELEKIKYQNILSRRFKK